MTIASLYKQDLLSIAGLSRNTITELLKLSRQFKYHHKHINLLHNKILANCFFEPSTRTKFSFTSAIYRLGGKELGFAGIDNLSIKKGETYTDSIRILGAYADIIVFRHPEAGSATLAAASTDTPLINAGDGANQHPSQTLIDLFSIQECFGRLQQLNIGICGDLKYSRTVHSLVEACTLFDMQLFLIAPTELELPQYLLQLLTAKKISFVTLDINNIAAALGSLDILYVTRLQRERLDDINNHINNANHTTTNTITYNYKITLDMLKRYGANHLKVLHPLPRVNELEQAIDSSPYAYYFQQAANGVPVRQAILAAILAKECYIPDVVYQ